MGWTAHPGSFFRRGSERKAGPEFTACTASGVPCLTVMGLDSCALKVKGQDFLGHADHGERSPRGLLRVRRDPLRGPLVALAPRAGPPRVLGPVRRVHGLLPGDQLVLPGEDDPRQPGHARQGHDARRGPPRAAPPVLCGPRRSPRPCLPRARHGRAGLPRRPEPMGAAARNRPRAANDAAALGRHGPAADPHASRRGPRRPLSLRAGDPGIWILRRPRDLEARSGRRDPRRHRRGGDRWPESRSRSSSTSRRSGRRTRAPCRTRSTCSAWRSSSRGSTRRAARGWPPPRGSSRPPSSTARSGRPSSRSTDGSSGSTARSAGSSGGPPRSSAHDGCATSRTRTTSGPTRWSSGACSTSRPTPSRNAFSERTASPCGRSSPCRSSPMTTVGPSGSSLRCTT